MQSNHWPCRVISVFPWFADVTTYLTCQLKDAVEWQHLPQTHFWRLCQIIVYQTIRQQVWPRGYFINNVKWLHLPYLSVGNAVGWQHLQAGVLLESVPTVLTQPGTPVSFRGMLFRSLFDFRKLRIFRCFPFPENSGLRRFPIFSYYVILLVSCLHPSLVTPSAVGNTSLSPDPQFPLALLYCFRLCNSDPILCTQYNSIPLLSYKYLYSVPRLIRIKITVPTIMFPISSFVPLST